jgi:3-hydroxybutyryl-CoA dehydrogenase
MVCPDPLELPIPIAWLYGPIGAGALFVLMTCFSKASDLKFANEFSFIRFLCKKLVMRLVVLAAEQLKKELLINGTAPAVEIIWIDDVDEFAQYENADGYIDLLFDNTRTRIEALKNFSSQPVIINSVIDTLEEINAPLIRINAWPGFLKRPVVEASSNSEILKEKTEKILNGLNKKTEWLPDKPGFVAARVIAMIINEAWFALEDGISTKEEIDTAMRLGTNYPYGPFEWGEKIGLINIYALLNKLNKTNVRYRPAELMKRQLIA